MTDKASCSLCDRKTCLPEDYAPLCTRHYLLAVDKAQRDAAERFQKHIDELRANRDTP
jgi:hypothetical protein